MLINSMVGVNIYILIHMSNYHIVHFKYIIILLINYASMKLKKETEGNRPVMELAPYSVKESPTQRERRLYIAQSKVRVVKIISVNIPSENPH